MSRIWERWLLSLITIGSLGTELVNASNRLYYNNPRGISFDINQIEVERPKGQLRNIAMEVRQTYHKYGMQLTKDMAAAGSVNISANPEYKTTDRLYLTPISIGTPAQSLNIQFDTGSSDLWVFSDKLPTAQIKNHAIFNTTKSKTWARIKGATFNITYQDGDSASGPVGKDVFRVGSLSAPHQAVEVADNVTPKLTADTPTGGIVGLAFSGGNLVQPTQQQTFFDNIAGSLNEQVFCVDLHLHKPGSFSFGSLNTKAYTGFILYLTVDNSRNEWSVALTGWAVSGLNNDFVPFSQNAIIDTGTAAIYTDPAVVNAYWGQVQGAQLDSSTGLWQYPCNASLPALNLEFTGNSANPNPQATVANIFGKYLNYKNAGGKCYGALLSNNGNGLTILGDGWFKSQYTCFDQSTGSPRIGYIIKDQNW